MGPVVFLFPLAVIAVVFTFTGVIVWVDSRRKEREAFYKAETLRRITESSGEGAKAAIELMREDDRLKWRRRQEGMKIGGLICIGVGIGTIALLSLMGVFRGLPGLIPLLVGAAMLIYVYALAAPVE
jgi:hypothetical protein